MSRVCVLILVCMCGCSVSATAQLNVYGQASTAYVKSSEHQSQLTVNDGRPTFLWRADLFADAMIVDGVTALMNIRILHDEYVRIDYLAIRISDLTPLRLTLQAGKFDMPFGNLYNRRFPKDNFLFDLPLIYHYQTVVMSNYAYLSPDDFFARRGRGGMTYTPSSLPLLDRGIYGTGVMLSGSAGIFDIYAALMNGTVSNTGAYTNALNINNDFGKIFRVTLTPVMGFTLGASYAWGSYLHDMIQDYLPEGRKPEDYRQQTAGLDVEFSRGHLQIFAHGIFNRWEYPLFTDPLDMWGYFAEAKYTLAPRIFVAGRINQLIASDVTVETGNIPWEYDVTGLEGGIGYALDRNTLAKIIYRHTIVEASPRTRHSAFAVQLVAAF
jgi:hypothetical protein